MRYQFTNHAKNDLLEASTYYDSQRDGLGAEFLIEIGIGIARVLDMPSSWPEIEPGVRKYRLDRFPYGILYHVSSAQSIEIVAIFDLRRRPGSWHH